eukprot:10951585-Karenia_brevis.AAC.1
MRNEGFAWPGFNHSLQCFATKKKYQATPGGVAAHAGQLRPLSLKNSDNKVVAAANAFVCMP